MSIMVETTYGKVEGVRQGGIAIFRGIPYAAPPIGDRRWLPPQPPEGWAGVRQADTFGAAAPQRRSELSMLVKDFDIGKTQSEDCLFLNVWSPGADNIKRPVMVWIHGGAFAIGSGSQSVYEAGNLSKRGDVVVVTINYRLGPFGFLNLAQITDGKIPATGNEGLLDQLAALKWVRDNIAGFGGDPDNVTVLGESAGGISIGALLGVPRSKGLFRKAILQSGAAHTAHPLDRAVMIAGHFLDGTGLKPDHVNAIRSLTTEQLLAGADELMMRSLGPAREIGAMPFQPVVDGEVLPGFPIDAVKEGSAEGIPILVGTTLDEWKLFGALDPRVTKMDETRLLKRCQRLIPHTDIEKIIRVYRKALTEGGRTATPSELFMAIQTDRIFRIPALRLAEAESQQGQAVYNYLFTWPSPLRDGVLGACHALEIGFVFGNHAMSDEMAAFSGSGPAADTLAVNMQDAWLAFARTGNPSFKGIGRWPIYDSNRGTMMIDKKWDVTEAPLEETQRAWELVSDEIVGAL